MKPLLATPFDRLSRRQRSVVAVLFAAVVLFGGIVEMRSAFLKRRMTDLDVYLRAAWAVRVGADPYAITDDNGWHYMYPPLLAVVLVPLADPPAEIARTSVVPFAASVAFWYALNVLWLALGTHSLANALEGTSHDPRLRSVPVGCQRWWALRVLPVLVCITPIGVTLSRGQINLVVLALLCATAAATVRGRSFRAGLWLSAAICVKVFPAFLVLYPLWRRDRRYLAGCAVGLLLGLAVVPAAVFGPWRALALTREWTHLVLRPTLEGGNGSEDTALLAVTKPGNQSIAAVAHNILSARLGRAGHLSQPSRGTRVVHWLAASLFTALTLAVGRRRPERTVEEAVFIGLLTVTMLLVTPFSRLHYFTLALPLVMALVALDLENHGSVAVRRLSRYVVATYPVANALSHLPGLDVLRQFGLVVAATTMLWVVGLATLWMLRGRRAGGHPALPLVRR